MRGHRLEVADVFRAHQHEFLQRWGHVLSDQQRKVLRDIGLCRTAALGTHLERCDRCSYETVAYDSCRNRHCPKCQSSARDRWLLKQARSLLPVSYAHVVFTVPEQLASIALRNQRIFYTLLFRAASETLLEIAADPRHLGARIGVLAVLHTWSQNLQHHPHLHCLIPAGGLALDNSRCIATRRGFFLPVRVLSRMFRGKLIAFLKQSYRRSELCFAGKLAELSTPRAFHALLHQNASFVKANGEYFDSVGTRVLMGRGIGMQDTSTAPPVAVVNESFVKMIFQGKNPIGARIGSPETPGDFEVVGVVEDTAYQDVRWKDHSMYFVPMMQRDKSDKDPIDKDMRSMLARLCSRPSSR